MFLDAIEMKHQSTEGGIVGVWQLVDNGVDRVTACSVVLEARSVNEGVI